MNSSKLLSGSLTVFYPCRVKQTSRIKRVLSMWKHRRKRQLRVLRNGRRPLTDLMDAQWIRCEMDDALNRIFLSSRKASPYATECIKNEYCENWESKQSAKETSITLSRFQMSFCHKGSAVNESSERKLITVDGLLLFSLNLDNLVGTFIVNLCFDNLTVEQIIFLKHIFYKRFTVEILSEGKTAHNCKLKVKDNSCLYAFKHSSGQSFMKITIPEYVIANSDNIWKLLKGGVDFRARYSLLEINREISDKLMYGLINADEGFRDVPKQKISETFYDKNGNRSLSTRNQYSYYVVGQNGLIINKSPLTRLVNYKECFFGQGEKQSYHIKYDVPTYSSCIAGVCKGRFKTFLKSVELHYLVNAVTTNEIEVRQQSHVNPFIFIRRAFRLWEIIYEIDMNPYHTDKRINESFETTQKVHELKEEYKSILNLTIGYATVLIAIFTLIFTIAQLCR